MTSGIKRDSHQKTRKLGNPGIRSSGIRRDDCIYYLFPSHKISFLQVWTNISTFSPLCSQEVLQTSKGCNVHISLWSRPLSHSSLFHYIQYMGQSQTHWQDTLKHPSILRVNTVVYNKGLSTIVMCLFSIPKDGVTFKCNHNVIETKVRNC